MFATNGQQVNGIELHPAWRAGQTSVVDIELQQQQQLSNSLQAE